MFKNLSSSKVFNIFFKKDVLNSQNKIFGAYKLFFKKLKNSNLFLKLNLI